MPVTPTYPGVYIEEVSSGVRTISGVATSITGFVGYFSRGQMHEAVRILSISDFERTFGGLRSDSLASYAIDQFFLNGGSQAFVVRTASSKLGEEPATAGLILLTTLDADSLTLGARNPGVWGNLLRVEVNYKTTDPANTFNLIVREIVNGNVVNSETFRNLTMASGSRNVSAVVNDQSKLIRVELQHSIVNADRPAEKTNYDLGGINGPKQKGAGPATASRPGADGKLPGAADLKTALKAFDKVDLFNILCLPDTTGLEDTEAISVIADATLYCEKRRAFYVVDVPQPPTAPIDEPAEIENWLSTNSTIRHKNLAIYYPRPLVADPLDEFRLRAIPSSGTIAGLYARTDSERGVWKAPAGLDARLRGVQALEYLLTDDENGVLNPLGVNCLRNNAASGNICWGARTLVGSDLLASEWKYVPVRRLALFLEESLYRGTQWVVFEPNDEPLWAQIRLNLGAFLHGLFRQGAFQGQTSREAYLVKCDKETTTQDDINRGIVNIVVGFAPLKPAEFVILKIQQLAGQIAT